MTGDAASSAGELRSTASLALPASPTNHARTALSQRRIASHRSTRHEWAAVAGRAHRLAAFCPPNGSVHRHGG
jgi:hypothetical protein